MTDSVTDSVTDGQITDEEVVRLVTHFLDRHGLSHEEIGLDTELWELGLDSITTVGLLISARDDLVATGRLRGSATLQGAAPVQRIGDLVSVLRELGATSG